MENLGICECCGSKIVKYSFVFNKGLARCLYLMRNSQNGIELKDLKITGSMYSNFPKLRYWNLIEPIMGENTRKGGCWKITRQGLAFLAGEIDIPKKVTMFKKSIDSFSNERIYFKEISNGYEYRQDYKDQAREQL